MRPVGTTPGRRNTYRGAPFPHDRNRIRTAGTMLSVTSVCAAKLSFRKGGRYGALSLIHSTLTIEARSEK